MKRDLNRFLLERNFQKIREFRKFPRKSSVMQSFSEFLLETFRVR